MKLRKRHSYRDVKSGRKGYSIIEVLVMIVVLAILAALLMPSFGGMRSAANQIGCSMELKRITDGLNQHAEDHDNLYTIAGGVVPWEQIDPETQRPSWMQQVSPYLPDKDTLAGCAAYPVASPYHYFLGARAAYVEAGNKFAAVDLSKVRFPDSFVVTGDNNNNSFNDLGPFLDADKDDYTFMTQVFSADDTHWAPQHAGMLNTAFSDGHVAIFDHFDPDRMTYRYDTMSPY